MQSLGDGEPASVSNEPTTTAPPTHDQQTNPPADVPTAPPVPPLDPTLLSSLLKPQHFPRFPLPPLSTSAPRLDSRLEHYQQHPPPTHNPRLHSTLTPQVVLTSALYPTTEQLLLGMSHADVLRVHLDDMAVLVHALVDAVGSTAPEAALSVLERVMAKQRAIDDVTKALAAHQQRQQRIEAVKRDIQQLDDQLIHFATQLSTQQLALSALLTPTPTHSSTPLPSRLRPMSVESLVSYAQRLSAVSFAPSDVTERKGVSSARPPAPLETEMAASVLQLSADEMVAWMEARRSEDAEAAAAAGGDKAMAFGEERKEALALPTVAEVESARAGATAALGGAGKKRAASTAVAPTAVRRAPSVVAAAASLLDLDLNPDMDESDDEDEDSDEG